MSYPPTEKRRTSPLHDKTIPSPSLGAFGLLELAHGENVTVDIVALHGLDGHRETSWTAGNDVLWLRHLLPARIPNARIFSYGYDGNTRGRDQLSTASIHDQGMNLISHLALKRKSTSTEDRPIIFVAHSLGGIILKSALIHANTCGKDHLPDHKAVEVSTSGILFFGTPHQGSEAASLGSVMLNVLSAFGKGTAEIVKDIQSNSKMLQHQLTQYQAISSRFSTKFYVESYETPVGPVKKLLVPRYSAVVPGAVNAEAVFLNKNHIDMVKFESAADEDFNLVASQLSIMAEEAPRRIMDRWKSQNGTGGAIPEEANTFHGTPWERKSHRVDGVVPIEEPAPLPELPYQEVGESFVGRDQALEWVHETFKSHRKLVLHGIGGIGKTSIAVEYVYTHRREYDIVFWVNGDTSETTTSGFIGIAQQLVKWRSYGSAASSSSFERNYLQTAYELGLDGFVDNRGKVSSKTEDRADILKAVKEWLSQSKSGTWLLIFDNVDDLDSFDLAKFFPTPVVGRILITSRKLDSRFLGTGYEVTALSEDDSVQLLVNRSQAGEADNVTREIVRRLEGLPLAIELAAAYIAALQLSYKSYLEFSEESWKSVFTRSIKPYGRSLIATWEISYQAISSRSPSAANLLLLCAFLKNEDIPERLFRGKFGATFNEALEQIFAFSLAKRSPTKPSSFTIHPMVHAWARERLSEEQKAEKVTDLVIILGGAISQTQLSLGHTSTCARHALKYCLPNLHGESDISIFQSLENIAECEQGQLLQGMLLLALEATESVEGPDSVETFAAMCLLGGAYLRSPGLQAGGFLQKALQHLHQSHTNKPFMLNTNKQRLQERPGRQSSEPGVRRDMLGLTEQEQWKEAERLFLRSLEGFERILGLDHPDTLGSVHNLAVALDKLGRFEGAEKMDQRALEGRERTLGLDHPDTLQSVHSLAIILDKLGRFEEAEKMHRRALESRERTLGLDHPDTLQSVHNLAVTLHNLGRFEEAEKMHRRAVESRERTLGLDHPYTLNSVHNLAVALDNLGQFEEAEKMGRRAVDSRERNLGLDHPDTLQSVHNLAVTLHNLGRFEEAEKMHRRAVESRERTLGLDHPDTRQSVHSLAVTLHNLGRFEEAEKMHRRAVESRERTLGLDHPYTLNSVHSLAIILDKLGRFEEAEKMHRRAVESRERTLGLDHPDTLQSVHSLAVTLHNLGQFEEAEKMGRRAVDSRERTLGLDHPDTLGSVHNLAVALDKLGRFEEAEKMGRRAVDSRERTLGLDHPYTLNSVHSLALTLHNLGRFEEAEKMGRRAVESRERTLGLDHPDTLQSVHNLAVTLHNLGRFEEAEKMHRRAVESRERTLGLDHPYTLNSVHNLAVALDKLGRFEEAEKMGRRAVESRERTLGLDHPDTLQSVHNLAVTLHNLGRFEEAEKMHRRAVESRERTLGLDHPDTLHSVHSLAVTLHNLGRFEEAEKMGRRAVDSRERTLGLDHPDTLHSVHNLAATLHNLGRFEEAEKMGRRAVDSRERTLGLDHPDTLDSVHNLAITLGKLGRFEEAEKMRQRTLISSERTLTSAGSTIPPSL